MIPRFTLANLLGYFARSSSGLEDEGRPMTLKKFLLLSLMINFGFLFAKIYQHNSYVRLAYQRQALENEVGLIQLENETLLACKLETLNFESIDRIHAKKMQPLALRNIYLLHTPPGKGAT